MAKTVIDISKFNNKIEYSKIKSQVNGVIIRAGYRAYRSGELMTDPLFKNHIDGCVRVGIPVGIYYFTTALNAAEGRAEADYAVKLIKGYKLSFPIFVDTEMSNNEHNGRSDSLGKEARTTAIIAFCERIKELGYVPGIYASDSWFVSMLDYNKIQNYKLWVASYSKAPVRVPKYVGWQYTSTNTGINGTNGKVDTSYWYEEIGEQKKEEPKIETNKYTKPTGLVKKGMKGDTVKWVQWELNKVGGYKLKVDGDFGNKTLAAVKDFQKKNGLKVDGIVGPKTIQALLNTSTSVKMAAPRMVYSKNDSGVYNEGDMLEVASPIHVYKTSLTLIPIEIEVLGECKVLEVKGTKLKVQSVEDQEKIKWIKTEDIN